MGAGRRLARFGGGSALGAGLGAALAVLFARQSGEDLRHGLRERLRRIRLAGVEAQAAKTDELVRRFRETVDDPLALADAEAKAREQKALAAAGLAPVETPPPPVTG